MSKYENIYEPPGSTLGNVGMASTDNEKNLIGWVLSRVDPWMDHSKTNYVDKWDEYFRLYRGIHNAADKTRDFERSKIISPALQQAIEATVAEQEEATFGRKIWFDLEDDILDEEKEAYSKIRDLLREDLEFSNVPSSVSEVFLNGALYGTGIGKVIVEQVKETKIQSPNEDQLLYGAYPEVTREDRVSVKLEAIDPRDFAIDPMARTIEESIGVAHVTFVPRHIIEEKQEKGIYKKTELGSTELKPNAGARGELFNGAASDLVRLVEWHGSAPRKLINSMKDLKADELPADIVLDEVEDTELVESIITIVNDTVILKAVESPFLMKDRSFIAYQHDTIPNRFWGRGIAEKGYNPQKALDAELRARLDSLALTTYPMVAGDITRLPRGMNLRVQPGKSIHTHGDPRTVLMPFTLGNLDPNTYRNAGDLERMVQMGTGAMDSATPTAISGRNDTASGMSMVMSGSIKRNKRTMQNIGRHLLTPLLQKSLWRYIQFDQERYPVTDYKFVITSTMGIMARELEQQQLISLISTVPPDSPAYWILLRSVYENSSISNKDEMLEVVTGMLESAKNPQPPQPEFKDQITAERDKMNHQREMIRLQTEKQRADQEGQNVSIKAAELDAQQAIAEAKQVAENIIAQAATTKDEATTILTLAKANSEVVESKLSQYEFLLEALKAEVNESTNSIRNDIQKSNQKTADTSRIEKDISGFKNEISNFVANSVSDVYESVSSQKSEHNERVDELGDKVDQLINMMRVEEDETADLNIERDSNGLVKRVNGKSVRRNAEGLIEGIEE